MGGAIIVLLALILQCVDNARVMHVMLVLFSITIWFHSSVHLVLIYNLIVLDVIVLPALLVKYLPRKFF